MLRWACMSEGTFSLKKNNDDKNRMSSAAVLFSVLRVSYNNNCLLKVLLIY